MTRLKKNIAANFAGNIWQGIMGLLFIPLYIKFMGVESYGLVGFFATLQAVFVILDMGLSATLTREMARLSVQRNSAQEMRDLVRSLEIIYWITAILIGLFILVTAPWIANKWVNATVLPSSAIEQTLRIMGFAMTLQWPASLYSGGIMGVQRQVSLNIITICISTLRGVGAVLILWLISPTVQTFFLWQMIVSSINTLVLALFLWCSLPKASNKSVFEIKRLAEVWQFAAGMSGISVLATILTQMDKIILSKMLSLETFGYYSLASAVAMSLYRLVRPIFSAIYPRFTQLVFLNDQNGLKQLYHNSSQMLSLLIFPIATVVAMFSYEILFAWTQSPVMARNSALITSILISGSALNGVMNIPYALQLANGWTRLTLLANLASIIFLIPLTIFLTQKYGAVGGASVWLILNCGYIFITIPLMHRKLLQLEKWRWYGQDIFLPLITALGVVGLSKLIIEDQFAGYAMILNLIIVAVLAVGLTAISTPLVRQILFEKLHRQPK